MSICETLSKTLFEPPSFPPPPVLVDDTLWLCQNSY